jgi:hypothetical protein
MSVVIDASGLIAYLRDEPGAEIVDSVLVSPSTCYAHAMNLCEVYYDFFRASDQDVAEAAIQDLLPSVLKNGLIWTRSFGGKSAGLKPSIGGFPWQTAAPWRSPVDWEAA